MIRHTVKRVRLRLRFWLHILYNISPVNMLSALGLIISLPYDTLMYALYRQNLLMLTRGLVFLRDAKLHFYVRSNCEDLYYIVPGRERRIEKLILNHIKPGDLFIDVGANIGYYTLMAAKKAGPKGIVIALEAVPETSEILKLNCQLNNFKNVLVINKAAWDKPQALTIHIPLKFGKRFYGLASIKSERRGINLTVDGIPLDTLTRRFDTVKLIKIDVEGAEIKVLLGAKETLHKTSMIIVEIHRASHRGEVIKILNECYFKVITIGRHVIGIKDL